MYLLVLLTAKNVTTELLIKSSFLLLSIVIVSYLQSYFACMKVMNIIDLA